MNTGVSNTPKTAANTPISTTSATDPTQIALHLFVIAFFLCGILGYGLTRADVKVEPYELGSSGLFLKVPKSSCELQRRLAIDP